MTKNKLSFNILILISLAILSLSFVSANSVNITSPVSGSNNTGTVNLACTFSNSSVDIINPLSANSSFSYNSTEFTVTGFTANATHISGSASISSLESLYSISCKVGNDTKQVGSNINSSIVNLDSVVPTVTSSITRKNVEQYSSNAVTGSCSDGVNGGLTTTRTLHKGGTGKTVSVSTSPYTLKGAELNVVGKNTWNVTCYDAAGNGAETDLNFQIETTEELPVIKTDLTQADKKTDGALLLIVSVIAIVVIFIGIILFINLKK